MSIRGGICGSSGFCILRFRPKRAGLGDFAFFRQQRGRRAMHACLANRSRCLGSRISPPCYWFKVENLLCTPLGACRNHKSTQNPDESVFGSWSVTEPLADRIPVRGAPFCSLTSVVKSPLMRMNRRSIQSRVGFCYLGSVIIGSLAHRPWSRGRRACPGAIERPAGHLERRYRDCERCG